MLNFRTISILTSFVKVPEKVICIRLYQHLIDNSILVNEKFVFIINYSAVKATHELLNEMLNALNN
jgi:hypothetical protein